MSVSLIKAVPQSGYTHCACGDCMDVVMSSDITKPELCSECEDAGCMPPEGLSGYAYDCQRDDAYGDDTDDTYGQDQCEGCGWETRNCACGG